MCLHSLSSDSLSDKVSAFFGAWSRNGSCDDFDPVWSHDLPTVTCPGTSGVTTSVRDRNKFKPELVVILGDVDSIYRLVMVVGSCLRMPIEQLALSCSRDARKGDVNKVI